MKISSNYSFSDHLRIIRTIYQGGFNSHGLEKWIEIVLSCVKFITPGFWIRIWSSSYIQRNIIIEWYIIFKVILLAWIVWYDPGSTRALRVAMYCLFDIVQVMLGFIFLNNVYTFAPSLKKNFAHLGINLGEIILSFSILYLHFHAIGTGGIPIEDPIQALYFSIVTFATVGYGDIIPLTIVGKVLVVAQIIISFLFITIICSSFVSDLKLKEH